MTWASDRRLDYIDWRLVTRGSIRRADISRVFDVSESQASADLSEFIRLYADAVAYDKSAKQYVPARKTYRAQRGMDSPEVKRALSLLAGAGQAMGWSE